MFVGSSKAKEVAPLSPPKKNPTPQGGGTKIKMKDNLKTEHSLKNENYLKKEDDLKKNTTSKMKAT